MDYKKAIEIAENIFWIGYANEDYGLHSNPYLMVDHGEIILFDAGSRPDFSTVMMKIMDAGFNPATISKLIYHHYDPDLCGSISNFEDMIKNERLEIISQRQNNIFIHHYSTSIRKRCINDMHQTWSFASGRKLTFINTPYSHSPGSFVTYDETTKTLFSSDIFGTYASKWSLFYEENPECQHCDLYLTKPRHKNCYFSGLREFTEMIMTSKQALHHSLDALEKLDIEIIAPQHGSVIVGKENVKLIFEKMRKIENIGIDRIVNLKLDY